MCKHVQCRSRYQSYKYSLQSIGLGSILRQLNIREILLHP